jgi:hypothetical protein
MRIRASVCSGLWFTALLGSLIVGCGDKAGVDHQGSGPSESGSVSEALPADDSNGALVSAGGVWDRPNEDIEYCWELCANGCTADCPQPRCPYEVRGQPCPTLGEYCYATVNGGTTRFQCL